MKVLVVTDMQNDFIDGALGTKVPILVDASCCAGTNYESHINALNAMKECQIEVRGEKNDDTI